MGGVRTWLSSAGACGVALATVLAGGARPARAADAFTDFICAPATDRVRAWDELKAHLPQPIDTLLAASRAVSAAYDQCAADDRDSGDFEKQHYALIESSRAKLLQGQLEARAGRDGDARRDLRAVISNAEAVLSYSAHAQSSIVADSGAMRDDRSVANSPYIKAATAFEAAAKAQLAQLDETARRQASQPAPSGTPAH